MSSAELKLTGQVSLEILTTGVIVLKYFVSLELPWLHFPRKLIPC